MTHRDRAPLVEPLLDVLLAHGVDFFVAGSCAALAHGVPLEPGDLDIVPDTAIANLERLAAAIADLEGRPPGPFGAWNELPGGEWRWVSRETKPEEIAAWRPDPADPDSFDHSLRTRLGNLDVVPRISGSFAELAPRAVERELAGRTVRVVHVHDLLARLTVPRREKDAERVRALRAIQRGNPED